jgi:hypothetical protein
MPSDDVTRRGLLAGAGGLAAGGALAEAATAQAPKPRALGIAGPGRNAVEVIGALVQDGDDLTGHGYLTRIAGLSDALLYASDQRGAATARFTFSSSVRVVSLLVQGSVFVATGVGTIDFFLDPDGGGDFAAPATFADGTRIARYDARFQNVLTVIAPDKAVIALEGELVQRQAPRFTLAGRRYRLGRRRLRERLSVKGLGTRTDATVPRAVFDVAGHIVLAG